MGKVAEGERQTGRSTVEKALPWKATEPRPTPQKPLSGEGKRRGGGVSVCHIALARLSIEQNAQ